MKSKISTLILFACTILMFNANPANAIGLFYTDATYPITATGVRSPETLATLKRGEASTMNILGVAEWGDAGINKAAEDGNIKNINFIDVNEKSIFIFFRKLTVSVYGE